MLLELICFSKDCFQTRCDSSANLALCVVWDGPWPEGALSTDCSGMQQPHEPELWEAPPPHPTPAQPTESQVLCPYFILCFPGLVPWPRMQFCWGQRNTLCFIWGPIASWETLGWKKHRLESRLPGEISITSDMQMTPPLWQKVKRNSKASWWKWNRRVKNLA